ncbi:MAG: hypothetical protein AB7F88_14870 [Pyrinomonadaceae bacterium]
MSPVSVQSGTGCLDEQGVGILATTSDEDYELVRAKIVSDGRKIDDGFCPFVDLPPYDTLCVGERAGREFATLPDMRWTLTRSERISNRH